MSNTFLGGNAALADKLSAKRAEVDQSLAQVAEEDRAGDTQRQGWRPWWRPCVPSGRPSPRA